MPETVCMCTGLSVSVCVYSIICEFIYLWVVFPRLHCFSAVRVKRVAAFCSFVRFLFKNAKIYKWLPNNKGERRRGVEGGKGNENNTQVKMPLKLLWNNAMHVLLMAYQEEHLLRLVYNGFPWSITEEYTNWLREKWKLRQLAIERCCHNIPYNNKQLEIVHLRFATVNCLFSIVQHAYSTCCICSGNNAYALLHSIVPSC